MFQTVKHRHPCIYFLTCLRRSKLAFSLCPLTAGRRTWVSGVVVVVAAVVESSVASLAPEILQQSRAAAPRVYGLDIKLFLGLYHF
jgi:hypothetical protein